MFSQTIFKGSCKFINIVLN